MALNPCVHATVQRKSLQWPHYEYEGVSNHRRIDCLLNRLIKENNKALRHWPLWGEFTGDRLIPRINGQ